MLRYILDTDHLTLLERGEATLLRRLALQPSDAVGTSVVTVEEALRGRLGYLARYRDGTRRVRGYALLLGTIHLIHTIPILAFDEGCEAAYQRLRSEWPRLGAQDLKIAAIAMVDRVTLLTRNHGDFGQINGLPIADWSL